MIITLKELPIDVNAEKLAAGLLGFFTENERTVLQFGMLPAEKMKILEENLKEKFEGLGKPVREVYPDWPDATTKDDRISRVAVGDDYEIQEWSLRKLVSEAVHEISLELYRQGDLVV